MRSLTEALLEGGRLVDEPDKDQRKELPRLEDLGLVSLTWSTTILCVDHGDDFDLEHAWEVLPGDRRERELDKAADHDEQLRQLQRALNEQLAASRNLVVGILDEPGARL